MTLKAQLGPRDIFINGRKIILTPKEVEIVYTLAFNKGKVITSRQLSVICNSDNRNSIRVMISRIRTQLRGAGLFHAIESKAGHEGGIKWVGPSITSEPKDYEIKEENHD